MTAATFRVVTLNCWNVSEPFEARMGVLRTELQALQADVVCLQEIVVRRDGFDQAARILDGLRMPHVFGPAFRWSNSGAVLPFDAPGDAFGNVIASRWPIVRHHVRALPGEQTGERRSALATIIQAPFGVLPVITTHFNWKFDHGAVRERQALAVAQLLASWTADGMFPPILTGDLNAEPDATEIRFLCGLHALDGRSLYLQDAWRVAGPAAPGWTWDNRNRFAAIMYEPDRRIDYIMVGLPDPIHGGRGRVERVRLAFDRSDGDVFASDHFGLVADIRV